MQRILQNIFRTPNRENLYLWINWFVMRVIGITRRYIFRFAVIVALLNCESPIAPPNRLHVGLLLQPQQPRWGGSQENKGKPAVMGHSGFPPLLFPCWRRGEERPPAQWNPPVSIRWTNWAHAVPCRFLAPGTSMCACTHVRNIQVGSKAARLTVV